ncbi:DUF6440 family protein [Clostridium sp.]|uniref:DUF6440 family protein n=1 Tax=Clostridium sp. TaxID=1506 RepID=UPI001B572739|nr:DUF6440 family protein [Clostridium sp.]MBP3916028.1 hypothetical protein [Clostridium sp.]
MDNKEIQDKRFVEVHKEGIFAGYKVLIDSTTGINYLFAWDGYAGGMTPLLDGEGRVVISRS